MLRLRISAHFISFGADRTSQIPLLNLMLTMLLAGSEGVVASWGFRRKRGVQAFVDAAGPSVRQSQRLLLLLATLLRPTARMVARLGAAALEWSLLLQLVVAGAGDLWYVAQMLDLSSSLRIGGRCGRARFHKSAGEVLSDADSSA